jgi:hypothetical protein
MSDAEEYPLISLSITEALGERCPDFDLECWCCKAWAEFDALRAALVDAEKDRDYWKVEAEGEQAKVEFRDKKAGNVDAAADRVVDEIHAEFNINLIGKSDNQRLRSAVARALKEPRK